MKREVLTSQDVAQILDQGQRDNADEPPISKSPVDGTMRPNRLDAWEPKM